MHSESDESFSSDSLDIETRDQIPTVSEISILLTQVPYVSSKCEFLEKLSQCKVIASDDLILGVCGLAKYTDIRGFLSKNFKKAVNTLLEKAGAPESVDFMLTARVGNIPMSLVLQMYSGMEEKVADYVLIVSRLYPVERELVESVSKEFSEFAPQDMRQFPYSAEQVFLLHAKLRQNTEVDGTPARLFLVTKSEFKAFVERFAEDMTDE